VIPAGPQFLSGTIASCAALLFVAGASKLRAPGAAGARGTSSAACTLLGISPRWCQPAEAVAGVTECAVGSVVCLGLLPVGGGAILRVAGGAALTALGLAFITVTSYARAKRAPGGCGCVRWKHAEQRITRRTITRACLVFAAGLADLLAISPRPGNVSSGWFGLGAVVGTCLLLVMTVRMMPRTRCQRRLWWPTRDALHALTGHPVFAAITGKTVAPARSAFTHSRDGCADLFFLPDPADPGNGTMFQVSREANGAVAVLATIRNQ
jgi:hypothetical protein